MRVAFWNRQKRPEIDPAMARRVAELEVQVAALKRGLAELDEDIDRRMRKIRARNGHSEPAAMELAQPPVTGGTSSWLARRRGNGLSKGLSGDGG